jgi:hypothetical protein
MVNHDYPWSTNHHYPLSYIVNHGQIWLSMGNHGQSQETIINLVKYGQSNMVNHGLALSNMVKSHYPWSTMLNMVNVAQP